MAEPKAEPHAFALVGQAVANAVCLAFVFPLQCWELERRIERLENRFSQPPGAVKGEW